jgi:hypothetical protein
MQHLRRRLSPHGAGPGEGAGVAAVAAEVAGATVAPQRGHVGANADPGAWPCPGGSGRTAGPLAAAAADRAPPEAAG